MTFDLKMWHALRVRICLVCFGNILGVLYWVFYRRIWINSFLGVMNSIATFSFCTHLTFDLILRLRPIFRLGIHPYGCWHTSRNTISMDATFCSVLPLEEFFHGMDCQPYTLMSKRLAETDVKVMSEMSQNHHTDVLHENGLTPLM